jgi:hypothetical protein
MKGSWCGERTLRLLPDCWCVQLKFPLYDEQGQIVATGGIAADITARKQVEAALQAELAQAISARDEVPAV